MGFGVEVVSRALVLGALGWSGNAIWSVGGGFDLEAVSRALVLGAFDWSGNALKTVVMRVGPLQGT